MKRLLIDSAHPEEVRVAIADGTRLEDFESETAGKAQLKGNIYIGHVSRVEPSLQAAFITYGGNRNGFLAFGEVHPEYFHLPAKEKTTLLEELTQAALRRKGQDEDDTAPEAEAPAAEAPQTEDAQIDAEATAKATALADEADASANGNTTSNSNGRRPRRGAQPSERGRPRRAEGGRDDKDSARQPSIHRRYRIQDVLKEGQKILVQVVKEERGSKGAALTTYFSLPGRYTVLMPNTPAAGGISRKITDHDERRALRDAYAALDVPGTMGLIIRTAGVGQPSDAIQKDYANLLSLWEHITTGFKENEDIQCIHEDGSVIIRALRDMASDDIEEIVISGKRATKVAKDYAKNLMPETLKLIKEHKEDTPLFTFYKIENRLNSLHHNRVTLPSGGYLIINPTEALVAVDINSGRATQERNIEETALKTNLEACEELARQIRLRDLAGLIVVDFIDMEDHRNNRKVEGAMRKALRRDRARIQCGNISDFGLMEISRQRLRPSFGENHFITCPHCQGSGLIHAPATAALMILRRLEDDDCRTADRIIVTTSTEQVLWLLNHKRDLIRELEAKWKYQLVFRADDTQIAPDHKLDLIRLKSDGTETTQTIAVTLREQPELPPEQRNYGKNGRRERDRDDDRPRREDRRDEPRRDRDEPREASEERTERNGNSRRQRPERNDRNEGRNGNNRPTRASAEPELDLAPPAPSRGRRPQRPGAESVIIPSESEVTEAAVSKAIDAKVNEDRPGRGRRGRPARETAPTSLGLHADAAQVKVAATRDVKPAKPVVVPEDQPLQVETVTLVSDDAPAQVASQPRRRFEIKKQADTDAADTPLSVQQLSEESAASAKAVRPSRSAKAAAAPATEEEGPKKGSILARLIGRP